MRDGASPVRCNCTRRGRWVGDQWEGLGPRPRGPASGGGSVAMTARRVSKTAPTILLNDQVCSLSDSRRLGHEKECPLIHGAATPPSASDASLSRDPSAGGIGIRPIPRGACPRCSFPPLVPNRLKGRSFALYGDRVEPPARDPPAPPSWPRLPPPCGWLSVPWGTGVNACICVFCEIDRSRKPSQAATVSL